MASTYTEERDLERAVRVSWLGHSMFLIEDGGHRLVTDPFAEGVGYELPDVEADIILVSHDHFDHSNIDLVKGDPVVIRDAAPREVDGIKISGFPTHHDASGGEERGSNIVYRWGMQGITFVHLGDLGHALQDALAAELAGADVLFVPVGGTFTVDDAGAYEVVAALSPRIAVPMHFRNSACVFPIQTEEPFTSRFGNVEEVGRSPLYLFAENLPDPTLILVMDYQT
jgi:L-ascorbate metabolism protein UlaG (beta-lactamase superfamily)